MNCAKCHSINFLPPSCRNFYPSTSHSHPWENISLHIYRLAFLLYIPPPHFLKSASYLSEVGRNKLSYSKRREHFSASNPLSTLTTPPHPHSTIIRSSHDHHHHRLVFACFLASLPFRAYLMATTTPRRSLLFFPFLSLFFLFYTNRGIKLGNFVSYLWLLFVYSSPSSRVF